MPRKPELRKKQVLKMDGLHLCIDDCNLLQGNKDTGVITKQSEIYAFFQLIM